MSLDFNETGNKLTVLQKHVMQSAVKQINEINKISDITDRILDDRVIKKVDDLPFHVAMYLNEDFKLADQRTSKDMKFRNINEIANPVALEVFNRDFPETFYRNKWIVKSGRKKGTLITKPSSQLLGDAIYGASLCFIANSDLNPFRGHISGEYQTMMERAFEFHINGSFTEGLYIEHVIPIHITPNGKVFIGDIIHNVETIQENERAKEEKECEEQSVDDLEYEDYDDLER